MSLRPMCCETAGRRRPACPSQFSLDFSCCRKAAAWWRSIPSGDPTPSKADIAVTRDIINAAKPLGVTVHDHLIIGRGRHTSLRDLGLLS